MTIEQAYEDAVLYYKKLAKRDAQVFSNPWFRNTKKEAQTRYEEIADTKNSAIVAGGEKFSSKYQATLTRRLKKEKEYALLLASLSKGYIFVSKVRKDVTQESFEYLLNLHYQDDNEKIVSKIIKTNLKNLIPAFEVVMNPDKTFALVIKNVKVLQKLSRNKNLLIDNAIEKHINRLAEKISSSVKSETNNHFIYGEGGIAFESAARKLAIGLSNGETAEDIDASWRDFEKDIQVFYKGGDLPKNLVEALFDIKNTTMELKRISLKENSMGAGLSKDKTIEKVLLKIIELCQKGLADADEKFKELFQSLDENTTKRNLVSLVENMVEKNVDNIILKK